jgi:hypothetical protein
MAQQMITLEEAAEKLGISPEEMKKRLKTDPDFKRLSQIRDGSTVRFKASAIEELARQLGMASEADLPLAPVNEEPGSDDFKVKGADEKKKAKKADDAPLDFDSSEGDVFSLADEPKPAPPKSSGKLTPGKAPKSTPKMSDSSAGSSDSDVRLDGDKPRKGKPDEGTVPTEEIALDFSGPGSAVIKGGSSAKLSAPKSPPSSGKLAASDSGKGKAPPDSSEFELSLDADSDDFEMQMSAEGDEVDLGSMPKEKSGASSGRGGKSGINLHDPADSGIVLEKKDEEAKKDGSKDGSSSDSEPDFELSLDSSAAPSNTKLGAPKSGKLVLDADSDSEFELTLDDSGGSSIEHAALESAESEESADKGDIFETDFEIPPMPDESGSEAVALESDTDLEKSDFVTDESSDVVTDEPSESEVVLLGDEDEAPAGRSSAKLKGKGKKAASTSEADVDVEVATDDEEDASASKVLKGVKGKRRGEEDEDEDEAVAPGATIVERPTKPWGVLPALFLAPTLLVVLVGVLMGYEMLNTMWGYQQPRKPAAPIIRGIASNFDMELRDQ